MAQDVAHRLVAACARGRQVRLGDQTLPPDVPKRLFGWPVQPPAVGGALLRLAPRAGTGSMRAKGLGVVRLRSPHPNVAVT